ncbi:glycoside hydrolase family 3 protein [Nesterenkonia flava]|uniref:beta-N-acetylhexosaminidase n=1 Tax=Nesterenkonia flava TaxID=469799 RepID=A0ABU1FRM9_9MICC|nr:glycoside hydrolase family 3 N-terminal domain-containing protein [Nesterenkonia flava]MDR5710902.1 glycoside hydrolase family 3 N-terminal domain-containing protein [Nesterenkonia flava]
MTSSPTPSGVRRAACGKTATRPRGLVASFLLLGVALSACAGDDGVTSPSAHSDRESEDQQSQEAEAEREREEARRAYEQALAGPSDEHRAQAAELVGQMSVEQKAGQVLIGEYSGTDAASAAALVEQLHLGGMILMGHNIPGGTSSVDTEALAADLQTIAAAGGEDRLVPPILSVDQEGGLVTRVGSPVTEWPAPMAYGAADDATLTRQGHQLMAQDLLELGFTTSFAPNADVTVGAADPTIGSRSFGSQPEAVAQLALAGIRGLAEGGLSGSVKHFPGHGSVTEDSHYTLPVQEASLEQLRERDWAPFAAAVEAGVPMVMMGHLEVPALEEGVASSLSAAAYEEIRSMGHDGVIVTDAMNMAATVGGGDQASVRALAAGADLLLMPPSVPGAYAALVQAVESGELSEDRLNEAAERVVALVLWQQDLASGRLDAGPGVEVPEMLAEELPAEDADPAATALALSQAGLTLVEGECEAPLVDEAMQIAGGTEQDRARLAAAAEEAGLQVGWGPTVTLLGGSTPASGDIVVALDRPEALADSAGQTKLALYGRTPESFQALVEVLQGAEAPGALPVTVGEHQPGHSRC